MKTFLLFVLIVGSAAWYLTREKPGVGPKATSGFSKSAPLVAGLQAYRSAHNVYPPSLEDLVPDFLGAVPSAINGHPPQYERNGASFTLKFSYATPLPVVCTYSPETRWKCGWLM